MLIGLLEETVTRHLGRVFGYVSRASSVNFYLVFRNLRDAAGPQRCALCCFTISPQISSGLLRPDPVPPPLSLALALYVLGLALPLWLRPWLSSCSVMGIYPSECICSCRCGQTLFLLKLSQHVHFL